MRFLLLRFYLEKLRAMGPFLVLQAPGLLPFLPLCRLVGLEDDRGRRLWEEEPDSFCHEGEGLEGATSFLRKRARKSLLVEEKLQQALVEAQKRQGEAERPPQALTLLGLKQLELKQKELKQKEWKLLGGPLSRRLEELTPWGLTQLERLWEGLERERHTRRWEA